MKLFNFTEQISEEEFEKLKSQFTNPFGYYNPMIEIKEIIFERGTDPPKVIVKIEELGQEKYYIGIINKTKEN